MQPEALCNAGDNLWRGEQAELDRCNGNIGKNTIHLRGDKIGRYGMNGKDAMSILRRQTGQRRHAIASQSAKGFEISLNARPAGGIRAGNRQHIGNERFGFHLPSTG